MENMFFALDIGTRSVVGIVGTNKDGRYEIVDYEQVFHKVRAMRDGQIENIDLVCYAVNAVKDALETRLSCKLEKVSIAAAGRALKTIKGSAEQTIDNERSILPEIIRSLEYNAISVAQDSFIQLGNDVTSDSGSFSCVGYSVCNYWLDGYEISNLEGHKGRNIKTEIIAAFLPFSVMRSLYAVTSRCNLEVENMTLEPIAAINAIVPTDIRLLNIAIVDIGAGTSDIAISKNGSIVAYDMVTIAGDEITETLMREFLLDFDTAEEVKLSLSSSTQKVSFKDILGSSGSASIDELLEIIVPAKDQLCSAMAKSILALNDGAPVAVFLIGGGSQIPGLCDTLADKLNLPHERVALGGTQRYKHIGVCSDKLLSPEFVTPIGIGSISFQYRGSEFFYITVNEKKIMLMDGGKLTVLDSLLLAGMKATSMMGISPRSLTYHLNGQRFVDRGTPSVPGELYVNGRASSMETLVKRGDQITAIPAQNGKAACIQMIDLLDKFSFTISPAEFLVNGNVVAANYYICNNDDIYIYPQGTGPSSAPKVSTHAHSEKEPELILSLSSEPKSTVSRSIEAKENSLEYTMPSDVEDPITMKATANDIEYDNAMVPKSTLGLILDGVASNSIKICLNNDWIKLPCNDGHNPYFVELLNHSDIDPENPQGDLILLLNGQNANFMDVLSDGDSAEIRWNMAD